MSRNIKKARITRISKVKADRSLDERVTALEKQLESANQAVNYIQETNAVAMNELRLLVTSRAS
ncbi:MULTISPECIES: hypothetical protein [Providencia]|uniref:Uncharacterized protein n=2 Tax=Providencia TaxID=586 RepID=A0ABU2IXH2_9GAMM|nr:MULTISPECIES: hypothetical protein [Providencia]EJD6377091.1 hypothetical protein [Providencia rettgeri]ELR5117154.1 hypothetical protein [Providencia rettgeri]MBI6200434.1 hypothetical protein [Providencia rettgeri]MBO8256364.1 hypothetical protein [Providencia rettgeri]MBO8260211.1 hypothetical protein [Providencia rettgeri]